MGFEPNVGGGGRGAGGVVTNLSNTFFRFNCTFINKFWENFWREGPLLSPSPPSVHLRP
jgi:hypothetical protein